MGNRDRGLNVLGMNVRRWREEKGLTQEALAERADPDPTYISGIERGMRNPSVLSVVRIAKALGVTTSQLMERVDDDNNGSNSEPVRPERKKIYSQNNRRGGGNGKKTVWTTSFEGNKKALKRPASTLFNLLRAQALAVSFFQL